MSATRMLATSMPWISAAALRASLFKLLHPLQQKFECPICGYEGPFRNVAPPTGIRTHAKCARCGALERHRLQCLVIEQLLSKINPATMRMLHFAPERFFEERFRSLFRRYETADIAMPGVDHHVDLQALPFESGSYDIVYASHVLEHIRNDHAAIAEIRRILAPGGLAILPVPIVSPTTIEYPEPNPFETMHVRAPGTDYFDRFKLHFARIDLYSSELFQSRYQLFSYEDRSVTRPMTPLRVPMPGNRHPDVVPVCFA
jgi:Methylase involved in ubiquinone/menaquinone biosynthesis